MYSEQNFGDHTLKGVYLLLIIESKSILHGQKNRNQFQHQKITSNLNGLVFLFIFMPALILACSGGNIVSYPGP